LEDIIESVVCREKEGKIHKGSAAVFVFFAGQLNRKAVSATSPFHAQQSRPTGTQPT
jgi:hypothetical protein